MNARRQYLEAAASLLGKMQNRVVEIHPEGQNPLSGLSELPDWRLPGEMHLDKIAGGGSLNTLTGEFTGRLSGLLRLPGIESSLSVSNLSFDSRGNIDLTAYGQTSFHVAERDAVTLTIPSRRPLLFHFEEDGSFAAGGRLRIGFPDGNTVEGFFDIDDPTYEFGFSFSGSATFGLARSMHSEPTALPTG